MTESEEQLILKLAAGDLSKSEFLEHFRNAKSESKLIATLLDEAVSSENPQNTELSMIVGFFFGFSLEHLQLLIILESAEWHQRHEDVVSALDDLKSQFTLPALYHATQWIPRYLGFDKSRALAVKAIWAIGKISGQKAEEILNKLKNEDDPILAKLAFEQLKRRCVT